MNDQSPIARPEFDPQAAPAPMAMLAELTHRCPLKCPYCSNPLDLARRSEELTTEEWVRVFHEAARMGVLQLHLSGGEPAARRDLPDILTGAVEAGLYSNLITSGVGLTEKTYAELVARGLDHVQLSIQGTDAETADRIGGYRGGFDAKLRVAEWIGASGVPLTVNAVMHRQNLDRLEQTIELAVRLGARRLEIAHTQYHGWAYRNRAALMPTAAQVKRAGEIAREAAVRLKNVLVIDYVTPDHLATYPKPCMGGWGRVGLNVTPTGKVLPCHAAETITALSFDNVRDRPLAEIWERGEAFTAYRGVDWMPDPCKSCDRRFKDWGGCRCQAFAWNGDAATVDPACSKAPNHAQMREAALAEGGEAHQDAFDYRVM
ncbi:pyrroloquinoline quinone biosynthesis protein PqqE [Rubrimonas cliftonensis]|uniref:PqqA peptide cyclase n=1 Tax=Rubrimonas cliftonensis TaxID=89524 RepID=A0A1H4DT67_9RHOB|nr:pyrroloquinoline quinone biosynthesis protein PqqE [Rubrimonas cliftonensis]SEA75776.1 pyrroloquinoline quinone biosynthesis protein E [Rubrimonas cliftonensis]